MIKKRGSPKIFPGWMMVITGGILSLWGHGYYTYGVSAFFKPIASELGFSRAATSAASSIGRLEGGIEGPLTGWLADKYGAKWVIFTGVFFIGLALILMYFIHSLWAYYIVWGIILGTGTNIALTVPLRTAIANWFVRKRGLAFGVQWVFSGLSGMAVLPLIAWLIEIYGWRMTCLIGGVVMWVVGLPMVWLFIKQRRPEYYGLMPDGIKMEDETSDTNQMIDRGVQYAAEIQEVEFTARQALRTLPYWLLIVSQAINNLINPAMNIHMIPFLTDRGIDPLTAAGMMAIYIGAGIPARFIGGVLADRMKIRHMRFIKGGSYLIQAVGLAIFLQNPNITTIYIWFILYGFGHGASMPVTAAMTARYFGRKAFGSLQGWAHAIITPAGVIAPIYAGWVFDNTGSYISIFTMFAVMITASGIIAFFTLPPRPPTQITSADKSAENRPV
ncbi:MFS transporter [Chloroflexota bacterium]